MKRKLTCSYYFIILEKKDISREHTKNPNANDWARPDVTFWAVGYHSPPPPSPSYLFTCIMSNMKTHLSAKGLAGTRGE